MEMEQPTIIAAIYARKTNEQEKAESVTRQIAHAKLFAESKGWAIDETHIYKDDGISGSSFDRPAFLRMMAAVVLKRKPGTAPSAPPFQILIVASLDRIGREQIKSLQHIETLSEAGVRVWQYMSKTEILIDTPENTLMTQVGFFGTAHERKEMSKRGIDTHASKVRAGVLAGGRTYGYDHVCSACGRMIPPRAGVCCLNEKRRRLGHTERVINPEQAEVVRRIFSLCAQGFGQQRIAKMLNAEGARAGRRAAWHPTSVRDVLLLDTYRGEVVSNKTKKKDARGKRHETARPESEWIRVPAEHLRIVTDAQWNAAHARLRQTRESYMRATGGKLWGRPTDPTARKHLLTGMAACGPCGGSLEVRTQPKGTRRPGEVRQRVRFYACSSYFRKGKAVCSNHRELPLDPAERAVMADVERKLMTPEAVRAVLVQAFSTAAAADSAGDGVQQRLTAQITKARAKLQHLIDGLADTGTSPAIATAIRTQEASLSALEQELSTHTQRIRVSDAGRRRIEAGLLANVKAFKRTMRRQPAIARQILQLCLRERLKFTPEERAGVQGWAFEGEGSLWPLLAGSIPALHTPSGLQVDDNPEPIAELKRIVAKWNERRPRAVTPECK